MQSLQYAQASSCNILQPTWLSPAPPRSPVLQLNTNPHSNDSCIYPNSQPIQGNDINSPPVPGITCFISQVPPQFYTYGMGIGPVQSTQPVQYCSCYNCSQLMHPLTYPNRPDVQLVHSATNFTSVLQGVELFRPNPLTLTNSINMPSSLVQQQQSSQPQTLTTATSPSLTLQPKQISFQPQTLYYPQPCTADTRTNPSLNLQSQPQTITMRTGPLPQPKTTFAKTRFTYQSQPQTIMTANIFVPPHNVKAAVRIEPNSLLSIPSLQESLERGLSDVCSDVNHLEDCENPATPLTPVNLCIVETPEEDIQIVDDDELTSLQTTDINNRLPFVDFCTSENNASGPPYDKSTTIVTNTSDFIRPPLLALSEISSVSVGYSSPSLTAVVSSSMMESTIMTSTLPRLSPGADSEGVSSATATSVAATTDPKNTCSYILSKEPPSTTTLLCSSDVCDKMDTLNSLVSSETAPSDEFVLNSLILPIDSFLKSLENSNDLDINSAEMSSNDTPSLNTDEYSINSILPVFNECLPSLDTSSSTVSTSSVDETPLISPVSDSCSNYLSPLMISIPLDKVTIPKSQPNSQPESQTHVLPHSTSLVISIPKLVWEQASNVTKRNDSITKEKKLKISPGTSVTAAPNDDTKIKMASDTTDGSKNKYPAKGENRLRAKVKKKLRKILAQSPLLSSQDRKVIRSFFSHTGKCPLPSKPHRKYALRYCEKFQRYIGIEMNYINKKWRGVCVTDITGLDNTKRLVSKHKSSSKTDKVM